MSKPISLTKFEFNKLKVKLKGVTNEIQ
jgi:hypothetical protein